MPSRSELRKERNKKRNQKILAGSAVFLLCAGGVFGIATSIMQNKSNGNVIEAHVPQDVDALFYSEANDDSWDYFRTLAGDQETPQIINAEKIAVAFKDGESYLYVTGDKKLKNELEERNVSPVASNDNLYLLKGTPEGVVENGLSSVAGYVGKGFRADNSFGYVTNKHTDKSFFDGESGIPTNDWSWVGTFTQGSWDGVVEGLTSTDFNLEKFDTWVGFEKKPSWVKNMFEMNSDNQIVIQSTPENLSSITGNKMKMPEIDDITTTISDNGSMKIKFER